MLQPENHSRKYEALFSDIDTGRTKVPMFQRDFVWGKEQTAKLIDSIIKGYPIGTFILWKTREELRAVRNIGNINLPAIPKGDSAYYILDGQQRITSLYAVRKGIRLTSPKNSGPPSRRRWRGRICTRIPETFGKSGYLSNSFDRLRFFHD